MIRLIAARELRGLFRSPLAWVVLAGCQFILAYLFLIHLQDFLALQPRLRLNPAAPGLSEYLLPRLFAPAASVLMLITPLLSMRLVAEELRSGNLRLLQSAPLRSGDIILGKYLALLALLGLMLVLTALMPLALLPFVALDLGALAATVIGGFSLLALAAALGLYCSCLTRQPVVAAFSAFAALLLLWMIGGSGGSQGETGPLLLYLSLATHLQPFLRGQIDTGSLAYFGLFSSLFLLLAARRLDNLRQLP